MIRVLFADDHDLMRHGIRSLLKSRSDFEICGEARNGQEAVDKTVSLKPDVAVIDLSMPEMGGLEATRQIRRKSPKTQVLIFSVHDSDSLVQDVLAAGAHGYILKTDASTQLVAAVEAIAQQNLYFSSGVSKFVLQSLVSSVNPRGGLPVDCPLTPREVEITSLLAQGKSNKEAAGELFISVRTVETHRRAIFRKLEVNSMAELVRYSIRYSIIRA
jgi:DNA-binding NarL/FixJ family response regulator